MPARDERDPIWDGSLLDRLTSDEEPRGRAVPESAARRLHRMQESIRRDLESLLNTRRSCLHRWAELELQDSLLNLGLPDPTGQRLASGPERAQFLKEVEAAIGSFEPRLTNVGVALLPEQGEGDRTLRFKISARVRVDGSHVIFDSRFEPLTAQIELRRGTS